MRRTKNLVAGVILFFSLFLYFIFSFEAPAAGFAHPLGGVTFLTGALFSFHLFFKHQLKRLFSNVKNPIRTYGILMLIAGLVLETLAYVGNIPKIITGQDVFLFSPNYVIDMLIGLPHYIVLALVWVWFLKRYQISLMEQVLLVGIFWAIKVDQFHHLFMLIGGGVPGVIDFFIAGSIVAFGLCWPLLLVEDKIAEQFPSRKKGFVKYLFSIPVQVVPFIVLFITGFIYHGLILGQF
ncbi:MAG: hypothetical protein ACI8W7_001824 [Gammaproteobacteria bacterium]|jgi:hypothetical protein